MNASNDRFEQARSAIAAGQLPRAEQALREMLQREPGEVRVSLTLAQVLRLSRRSSEALEIYQAVLSTSPTHADALYQAAIAAQESGQLEQARQLFGRLVEHHPQHAEGLTGLGALLAGGGRAQEALPWLTRAVQARPELAQARLNLGAALAMCGRTREARAEIDEAIRLRPDYVEAWYNLGNVLDRLNMPQEAIAAYRRATELRPEYSAARTNLALLLAREEQGTEALELLQSEVQRRPSAPDALNHFGSQLRRMRRPGEASIVLRQALRLDPQNADVMSNLGYALTDLGRFQEAEKVFLAALDRQPDNPLLHANLGALLQSAGRHDEASAALDLAILLDANCAHAHYNRSMNLLAQGRWLEGWADYEYRFLLEGQPERPHAHPRWDGSSPAGKTLLLWAEQGLGDMIQFVRYADVLARAGARVILECPPHVVPLFQTAAGIDAIITVGDRIPEYDFHAPLASLPGLLRTTPENAPNTVPYLQIPAERMAAWRDRLTDVPGLRVGIAWRGSPRHAHDHWRSVPLERFAPLAAVPGARLVSLQLGPGSEEADRLAQRFELLRPIEDQKAEDADALLNTAALIASLDLVVCVDTAIGHLAGALAVPVWLAVAALPDWRWLRRGSRTVWYPTMRLYRQRRLGKWRRVFARMARDLREKAM